MQPFKPWAFTYTFDNGNQMSVDTETYLSAMQLGFLNPTVTQIEIFTKTFKTGEQKHFRTFRRNNANKFEDIEEIPETTTQS